MAVCATPVTATVELLGFEFFVLPFAALPASFGLGKGRQHPWVSLLTHAHRRQTFGQQLAALVRVFPCLQPRLDSQLASVRATFPATVCFAKGYCDHIRGSISPNSPSMSDSGIV